MRAAVAFAVLVSAFAGPASAVTINGDTTGAPVWQRTIAGQTNLSNLGSATPFEATSFTVTAGGSYDFVSTAGYDNYLHLYQGSFDPLAQFDNLLIANDDFPNIGVSGFSFGLLTGTIYIAVASGFGSSDFGAYSLSITGPGDVSVAGAVVPEPASWAMLIAGFGLVGATLRRRRAVAAAA